MEAVGRLLVLMGAMLTLVGVVLLLSNRLPFLGALGRLPGDLSFRVGPVSVFFPLATMLLVSVLLSVLLTVIAQLFRR